jgi:hypothetical protein
VAASVIIIAGLVFLRPFGGKERDENLTVSTKQDIYPGGNKAVLVLANGRKVILDSAANGILTTEGNVPISKTDGQLIYANDKAESSKVIYNTVTTPKGGQYRLTLSDGSKVWLNAASSIYYPVAFTGSERTVTIIGEVYFEIRPLSPKGGQKVPFIVDIAGKGKVEVLGTHFNVNAYANEPFISTTLAEGSVKVSMVNGEWSMLKPGQQAQINSQGEIKTSTANLEEALAWKDGQFLFNDALIENVMRQVARWYDAEVVYENKPSDHFNATVPRDVPVSKLLYFLEKTNRVHFKIENRKIIVLN